MDPRRVPTLSPECKARENRSSPSLRAKGEKVLEPRTPGRMPAAARQPASCAISSSREFRVAELKSIRPWPTTFAFVEYTCQVRRHERKSFTAMDRYCDHEYPHPRALEFCTFSRVISDEAKDSNSSTCFFQLNSAERASPHRAS